MSAMMAALAHRGPDGHGSDIDPDTSVHLGHQRLSIIDIADGAQPMWSADRKLCVIFNGEIYNHPELRSALLSRGRRFQTDHSDTEVLLQAYAEWGQDMLYRLNGMFAFCIYDVERKQLFLARDRFGEKPLYYAHKGNSFAFASELSAILAHTRFVPRRSTRNLQKYFAYGYVPAPGTLFENCWKLPGGSSLIFDLTTGNVRLRSYWEFRIEADQSLAQRSEGSLAEELRHLLAQSVRRRLLADVPVGIFLSGGIDSATALACATQILGEDKIQTFTLGFAEPSFDESGPAGDIARHFRSLHRADCLDLHTTASAMFGILRRLDEPTGDPSIVPTSLLAKFASRHVKVALSGDGGDELFAGYDPFVALAPARLYSSVVSRPLHHLIRRGAQYLPHSDRNMSLDFRINRTLRGLSYPRQMWNPVWLSPVDPVEMQDLFQTSLRSDDLYSEAIEYWDSSSSGNVVDRSLEFYTRFYLQEGILAKADRASMQASMESRAIFLDNDLVEFCRHLPHSFKLRGRTRKYLLKKAIEPLLPESVRARPKKGFGMPISSWLRTMPKHPPPSAFPEINSEYAQNAWREHREQTRDHRLFLWSWLSLHLSASTARTPLQPVEEAI